MSEVSFAITTAGGRGLRQPRPPKAALAVFASALVGAIAMIACTSAHAMIQNPLPPTTVRRRHFNLACSPLHSR
jgi:hypothetical protein